MNIEIREITKADVYETSKVYVDAVKIGYKDFIPIEVLNDLEVEKEAQELLKQLSNSEKFYFTLIAVKDKKIIGFISAGSNTVEPYEFDSEINEVFVKNDFQGMGIGLQLMYFACAKLKENGYTKILVYNFENSCSNGFYRNLNGNIVHTIEKNYHGKKFMVDVFGWDINDLIKTLENKNAKRV